MAAKYIILATAMFFVGTLADSAVNLTKSHEILDKLDHQEISDLQNKSIPEFKAQCERNGGPDAFDRAHNGSLEFMTCASGLVNTSQLQIEMEAAKPNGQLDEVFKKYCDKKPILKSCLTEWNNSTQGCFSVDEQKHIKIALNVSEQLVDFMCHQEGERIVLFISEGGQECFQNRSEELKQCFNRTAGNETDSFMRNIVNLHIYFDEKLCSQITELQHCVVSELEKCPKSTSANIVESVFKFIRKATPCQDFQDEAVSTSTEKSTTTTDVADKLNGTASSLAVTSATIIMAVATAIFI